MFMEYLQSGVNQLVNSEANLWRIKKLKDAVTGESADKIDANIYFLILVIFNLEIVAHIHRTKTKRSHCNTFFFKVMVIRAKRHVLS